MLCPPPWFDSSGLIEPIVPWSGRVQALGPGKDLEWDPPSLPEGFQPAQAVSASRAEIPGAVPSWRRTNHRIRVTWGHGTGSP